MNRARVALAVLLFCGVACCLGGIESTAIRDTSEWILRKFGKGLAGDTIEQIAQSTSSLVAKYGEECLPLLRQSGHAGFAALEEAGPKAPAVIKLYARRGDEALWIISEPKKLAIFLKHGDSAADALLKHPHLAETIIGKYGGDAVGAVNAVSRAGGQRLAIMTRDGTLDKIGRQSEVLGVIRRYGDAAMDFVWKNKGALTVTAALAAFLADPQGFVNGTRKLVVGPVVSPMIKSLNWTLIAILALCVIFGPFIAKSVVKSCRAARSAGKDGASPGGPPRPLP
jgi:hypothetical protein